MVVREAQRAVSYLGLFNYPVDSVVVNRVLPEMGDEGEFIKSGMRFNKAFALHRGFILPIPIWTAPYYAHEVVGLKALAQLATDCFGDADPGQIFTQACYRSR